MKNVTIDKNAETPITNEYDALTGTSGTTISVRTALTYNELLRRLIANDFRTTTVTMKDGTKVSIEPCSYADDIESIEDVEFFLVHEPYGLNLDSDDLVGIAGDLCQFDRLLTAQADSKERLHAFYEKNIAGHTRDEFDLGRKVFYEQDDVANEKSLADIAARFGTTEEACRKAYALVEAWDVYSDWHKSIYNYRPKFE